MQEEPVLGFCFVWFRFVSFCCVASSNEALLRLLYVRACSSLVCIGPNEWVYGFPFSLSCV